MVSEPPRTVAAGGDFSVTVDVEDANGAIATAFSGSVTIALANNPGGGTLGGTLTVLATNGVAVFLDLTINIVSVDYTFVVTSGTLAPATSTGLQVTPGAATQLIIASGLTRVVAGTDFSVTVYIEDSFGNIATGYSGNVTIALVNNPGGGTIGGSLTVVVVEGVAVFIDLTLNIVETNYTFDVTSGSLTSATSTGIQVTPARPRS